MAVFRTKLKVTPIRGELRRVFVDSERVGKPPYLIDLDSYDGNGECRCWNFRKAFEGKVRKQLSLPKNQRWPLRCKHIKAARDFLLDELIDKMKTALPTSKYNREN